MHDEITFLDDDVSSFTVDVEKRTITGLLVPWGKVAASGFKKWKFAQGSLAWTAEKRVKLNVGHERKETVGVAVRLQDHAAGLSGSFRVARGEEGDRALSLAEDGVLDGFSIEVDLDEGAFSADPSDESVNLVHRASLKGVALTGYPAFDDARVEHVAATREEGLKMDDLEAKHAEKVIDEQEGRELFEQRLAERVATTQEEFLANFGKGLTETLDASIRSTLETLGASQDRPQSVAAARFSTLNEPPVYRFDGGHGPSLVRDAWNAVASKGTASGDEAIDRISKFRRQSEDMAQVVNQALAFAPQSTSTAGAIIPPGYRPDLYVSDLFKERTLVNLASQGTINDATPFAVPKFGSVTSGSAVHVEGTNPSDGSLAFTTQIVTPTGISGRLTLTRELVDSSNPAIDQIAFAEMREAYARQTEAAVYTLLNGANGAGGTITSGFVPSGAQASTTAKGTDNQTLVKHLRQRIADYFFARFAGITGGAMGQTATGNLATAVDTTQRPLLPFIAPTNPIGLGGGSGGWQVDNVNLQPSWAMTGTAAGDSQIFLVRSTDFWVWESPLLQFRFEEKQGPANIELNIFGYFATALLRAVGLSGIRIT